MPNPGSPQSSVQAQQNMPAMSKGTMIGLLVSVMMMMVVFQFRRPIGEALNYVFQAIDFGGQWPVFTLVIAGLIMISLSTIVRTIMTDSVKQAENQQRQSSFNKEMRQARLENNLFKLKRLQEQQPQMMAKSMETSTQMMKMMPLTMICVFPIYAWVFYFLEVTVLGDMGGEIVINIPWGPVNIMDPLIVIPSWIVIYTMISLPIGQLEGRIIRFFLLKKRLKKLDGIENKS